MTAPAPRDELLALLPAEKRQEAGRLITAIEEAAASQMEEHYLRQPIFRGCIFPTCRRQFDSMATMSGREPARPEWSGKGWQQVRGSAVHSAGGYICPDHIAFVTEHFPRRGEQVPGEVNVRCACGTYSSAGHRWHGTARGLWEAHVLHAIGTLT